MTTHYNNMTPLENLHYALGELAYAIAFADGEVQTEEQSKFTEFIQSQLAGNPYVDIAGIIFKLLERKKGNSETAYDWAMNEVRLNSHYLSPELKNRFITILEKVAEAFPPVTKSEKDLLNRFKSDIAPLHGDPVYYGNP